MDQTASDPPARTLAFPPGFLWGTATAAHQVEGNNRSSDWWEWELRRGTPCLEPCGDAVDHFHRYPTDIALLADLGFNAYRFSVEWARLEPEQGRFDPEAVAHYRRMAEAVVAAGLIPMVTLNHFTLPLWLARRGGWRAAEAPAAFARYCREVVSALGDNVDWYCTINEPGVVAFGGYMGAFGFPPGTRSLDAWEGAIHGLIAAHRLGRAAVKDVRPQARVGATHSMQEWSANRAGRPVLDYLRRMNEDVFLAASDEDDFVGVQTYTRQRVDLPAPAGWLADAALGSRFGRRLLAQVLRSGALARVRPRPLRP